MPAIRHIFCHFQNDVVFQRFTVCDGRICLSKDPVFPAKFDQRKRCVGDMRQDLIDHRLYRTSGKQAFQVVLQKVRNADGTHLSTSVCVLKRPPYLQIFLKVATFPPEFRSGLRAVNDHQIQVLQSAFPQTFVY